MVGYSQATDFHSQLWKITGKGLPGPSYLFGTMHTIEGGFVDSFPAIGRALRESKVFVCETLAGSENNADYTGMIEFPPGDSLQNYLSAADYDTLMAFFRQQLTGEEASLLPRISRLKPQGAALLIGELKGSAAAGTVQFAGPNIDNHLQDQAIALGKTLIPLETIREQYLAVLASAEMRSQAARLAGMLKGETGAESDSLEAKAVRNYRNRRLAHYFSYDPKDRFSLESGVARNKKWMEKLPGIIKKDPAFIAVGHNHLISKQGLIILLRNQGYTVTPVPF
jgi:uncharacterized protein YbaP (TraB family)